MDLIFVAYGVFFVTLISAFALFLSQYFLLCSKFRNGIK